MINVLILFLVCMMALQALIRRSEERLPIGLFGENGALSTGRIHDVSVSGTAIVVDAD